MGGSMSQDLRGPAIRRALIVASLLVTCGFGPGLASDSPFARARALRLADRAIPLANAQATFSRLDIQVTQGALVPVLDGAGEAIGFVVDGEGKFIYRVTDPQDLRVFAANARANAGTLSVGDDRLVGDLRQILVLHARPVFKSLVSEVDARDDVPDRARSFFDSAMKNLALAEVSFDHVIPEARLNGGALDFVRVEIEGAKTKIGYEYDALRSNGERLFSYYSPPGFNRRYEMGISFQGRGGGEPASAGFSIDHVSAKVSTEDNRSGRIDSTLTVTGARPGLRGLAFNLINNRDPKTETWESERNQLVVERVVDEKGQSLSFSHRYHEIVVDLGRELTQGEPAKLTFETRGEIFSGIGGYRDDNYLNLSQFSWFPTALYPSQSAFTFDIVVRTKKPYRPVASGDDISLVEEGDHFVLTAASKTKSWQLAIFAGKYKTKTARAGHVEVRSHAYGLVDDKLNEQVAQVAASLLMIYQGILGPYPWTELDIVEVPTFEPFGISSPGLVLLTSSTFKPQDGWVAEKGTSEGRTALLAHEIAHQWFGFRAWPLDPISDNWITESFAEYMSGLAMGVVVQQSGVNKAQILDFKEMLARWRGQALFAVGKGTVAGANLLDSSLGDEYRFYLLYGRGPLVLHMLRTLIGEKGFMVALHRFLDEANYGAISARRFEEIISETVGQDMTWFFDQWIRGDGIPEIRVEHEIIPGSGRGVLLRGKVRQKAGPDFKKIHVPLILQDADGKLSVKLVLQEKPEQPFSFELPSAPKRILVDPSNNNLASYKN